MAFTREQINELEAPLNRANVKKNPKGFDYVEGWHAIAEANRIFGFDGWTREMLRLEQVGPAYEVNGNNRVAYRAVVRITVTAGDRTIIRDGTGYGSGIGKDLNDAHESAVKEAETDAMKRALMTFGNPFGLALYDKTQENVVTAPKAPSLAVTAAQTAITSCNTRAELTTWKAANDAMLSSMKAGPDYAAIENAYKARWRVLDPAADTFRGGPANGVANGTDHREGAVQ